MCTKRFLGIVAIFSVAAVSKGQTAVPRRSVAANVPVYVLNVELIPQRQLLQVSGSVRLPSIHPDSITLLLHSMFREVRFRVAGADVTPHVSVRTTDTAYVFNLSTKGAGSESLIEFEYEGGEPSGVVFSLADEASFASGINTNWYPELEGGGKAVGTLTFKVPHGLTVAAVGKQSVPGANTFKVTHPSYFWFAVAKYDRVEGPGGKGPALRAFLLHPRKDLAVNFATWAAGVAYLQTKFGPFPFDTFSVIEVPASQAEAAQFQGVSMEGAILVQSKYLENFSVPYFAHEITHQWWGVSVGHAGTTGRYLFTESMAQWAAEKFVEQTAGTTASTEFRKSGFGGGAEAYFDLSASGGDHRLLDLPSSSDSLTLGWTKGMFMLDALERAVGAARFQAALIAFQQEHAYGEGTWADFWKSIQSSAPRVNLDRFSHDWLEQTGAPEFTIVWRQEHGVLKGILSVTATSIISDAPVVTARDRLGHSVSHQVSMATDAEIDFEFVPGFDVADLTVDPEYRVLHWTAEFREHSTARAPYIRAEQLRANKQYAEAVEVLSKALQAVAQPDRYAASFLYEYELARIAVDQQRYPEAAQHASAALAAPTRDAKLLPWLYFGLAQLAKGQGRAEDLKAYVDAVVSADAAAGGDTGATEAARKLVE